MQKGIPRLMIEFLRLALRGGPVRQIGLSRIIGLSAAVLTFAAGGCGGGHTVIGARSSAAAQSYSVVDLSATRLGAAVNGRSFVVDGISDSGAVLCFASYVSDNGLASDVPSLWFLLSSAYNVVATYSTAPTNGHSYSAIALMRDGLLATSGVTTTTATKQNENGYSLTSNVITATGATIPIEAAANQINFYPAASSTPSIMVGIGYFSSDPQENALVWDYTNGVTTTGGAAYVPTILPTVPGMPSARAVDVNMSGAIVGACGVIASNQGVTHATLWDSAHKPIDLGLLPGTFASTAVAINDSNVVVGNSDSQAFTWTAAKGMVALPPLPDDDISAAVGIANSGEVFGMSSRTYDGGRQTGVVWINGVPESLNSKVTGGWNIGQVVAANKAGQVIASATSLKGELTYVVLTPQF